MKQLLYYETDSGKIRGMSTLQDEIAAIEVAPAGQSLMEAPDPSIDLDSSYVDLNTLEVLPRQTMTVGVTTATGEVTLTGLPDPCTIMSGGQEAEVVGGTATVQFDESGPRFMVLRAAPVYLDYPVEVIIP